jgi:hypothetical protein
VFADAVSRHCRARNPLGVFLAVTFAFSWVWEIVAFGVLDLAFEVAVIPAAFGPAIGA